MPERREPEGLGLVGEWGFKLLATPAGFVCTPLVVNP